MPVVRVGEDTRGGESRPDRQYNGSASLVERG